MAAQLKISATQHWNWTFWAEEGIVKLR